MEEIRVPKAHVSNELFEEAKKKRVRPVAVMNVVPKEKRPFNGSGANERLRNARKLTNRF